MAGYREQETKTTERQNPGAPQEDDVLEPDRVRQCAYQWHQAVCPQPVPGLLVLGLGWSGQVVRSSAESLGG